MGILGRVALVVLAAALALPTAASAQLADNAWLDRRPLNRQRRAAFDHRGSASTTIEHVTDQ